MIKKLVLKKFYQMPGKCSLIELEEIKQFLTEYKEYRDLYIDVTHDDPTGLILESNLDTVEWYIKRINNISTN